MKTTEEKPSKPTKMWVEKIRKFISLWPGTWGILVALAIFLISYPLVLIFQSDDMNIGVLDPGFLQNLPFASLEIIFLNEIIFLGIMLNFPILWHWYKKKVYRTDWLTLNPFQRWLIFILLYSLLFFCGTMLLTSLQ